jgi:hypothetical protein
MDGGSADWRQAFDYYAPEFEVVCPLIASGIE